jgi:hypothetical protein
MVYFQTKNPNLGKFRRVLIEDVSIFNGHLVYLRPFDIFDGHLVYFVVIWYISPLLGMLYREKSGNPAVHRSDGNMRMEATFLRRIQWQSKKGNKFEYTSFHLNPKCA